MKILFNPLLSVVAFHKTSIGAKEKTNKKILRWGALASFKTTL
jgi:hypothetical protein